KGNDSRAIARAKYPMNRSWLSTAAAMASLQEGKVSHRALSAHLILWIFITSLVDSVDSALSGPHDYLFLVHRVLSLIVIALGLWTAYRCNGGQNGREFVNRFAFLALPLTIRFTLLYEIVYWTAFKTYPFLAQRADDATYRAIWLTFDFLFPLALTTLWYWRM